MRKGFRDRQGPNINQSITSLMCRVDLRSLHIRKLIGHLITSELKVKTEYPNLIENTNFLLTEREGRTGKYWPEVVAVRTERSEVRTKTTEGQYSLVRLELARLVSSLLYGFLITFCFVFASP